MLRQRVLARSVSLALLVAARGTATAQTTAAEAGVQVGGPSGCPTPALVWQRLVSLVPGDVLVNGLRQPDGSVAPVHIIDLGLSFRVTAGARNRDFVEEARDCAKRAQFAAVFIAVVAGAAPETPAAPATTSSATEVAPPVATVAGSPPPPRARLELGVSGNVLAGPGSAAAPGLALRVAVGRRRFIPVVAVTALAPIERTFGGVGIRQWQATAEVSLRSPFRAIGRSHVYVEVGAALELLFAQPLDLYIARAETSFALGARTAVGWTLSTSGRVAPFLLAQGAWFPRPPDLFALPAGDLGREPSWNVGVIAGASWGILR